MRVEHLCDLDLHYEGDFHYVSRSGGESGIGWGIGGGTASGSRGRCDGRTTPADALTA